MTEAKHTAVPWSVQNAGDIWEGGDHPTIPLFKAANQSRSWGREYPHAERQANAAFVVRACNSHDALLAALKRCESYIASPLQMSREEDETKRRDNIVELARAAIASATGEA